MSFVNVISAIGNNDSTWPLLIRDCGCENPIKCILTYKQNSQDKFIARQATREKIIDEYGASAIWLGGIPLLSCIYDKFMDFTGFSSKVNPKLLDENQIQSLSKNIDKFKNVAKKEVDELLKVKNNAQMFKGLQYGKLLFTTALPIALMGFILPKINFAITKNKIKKSKNNENKTTLNKLPAIDDFINSRKQVNFTGGGNLLNITNIQKMMITDVGLGIGRTKTERTKKAQAEKAFGAIGAFVLNYITPKKFENMFNKISKNIFDINTELDPKILTSSEFIQSIKDKSLELPKNADEKSMLDFIDNNPKSMFSKIAVQQKIVSFLDGNVRDPRKYVDVNKLNELKEDLSSFMESAFKTGDVDKFVKTAFKAKTFTILSNIILSSFLLAYVMPKLQFVFRQIVTGKKIDPGIEESRKTA